MTHPWMLPPGDTHFEKALTATPRGFEIAHLDYALEHCKRFRCAVDGGAHVGTWSAWLSKKFKHVLAFEPSNDNYYCLKYNLRGTENVTFINRALGHKVDTLTFGDDPTRPGNSGARLLGVAGDLTYVTPLDAYDLQDLDFLKLDVEGYEIYALEGAAKTLERCKPMLVVECKEFKPPRNGGVGRVKHYLGILGYKEVGGVRNDRVFLPT